MGSRDAGASSTATSPDRVIEAHRLARQSLAVTAAFVLAAVVAALLPASGDEWLPLHLFLVGGLVSAISGATQMLAITWSSGRPPSRSISTTQQVLVAVGAVAVTAGRRADSSAIAATGGGLVAVAMVILGVSLVGIRRSAGTDRFVPAIDGYLAAIVCGVVGSSIGSVLVEGSSEQGTAALRSAHLFVNLYGFIGIVIAATLPYFVATQLRCKMSPRATPVRLRLVAIGLATATVVASIGRLTTTPALAITGFTIYAACLVATLVLLPRPGRRQLDFAGPRAFQLLAGIIWWIGLTLALAVNTDNGFIDETRLTRALVIGGYAPILMASVAYFAPVLRRGGHKLLTAGFAVLKSWPGFLAANVAATAAVFGGWTIVKIGLVVWALDTIIRFVLFWRQGAQRSGGEVNPDGSTPERGRPER